MRILSFSQRWSKLSNREFTTFRFTRKDKDWFTGEQVQVFYKNPSPKREKLGLAVIIKKEERNILAFSGRSNAEAVADGFKDYNDMLIWLRKTYGGLPVRMNKLTLRWIKPSYMPINMNSGG